MQSLTAPLALGALLLCGGVPATAAAQTAKVARHLGDRALRPGASGPDVRELQQALDKAGLDVTVTGRFDSATTAAVQAYQRAALLAPSGIVGKQTAQRLEGTFRAGAANVGGFGSTGAASTHSLGDRIPLDPGMSGHDVKILQAFLTRAGYKVRPDGQYGRATASAVRGFERAQKLPADSIFDAADINALRSAIGAAPAGDPQAAAPAPLAPGDRAQLGPDGLAIAPASAPDAVKQIIAAGNAIAHKPYRYGGGHGSWTDSGYDCSGSVSYALHGAGLLSRPLASYDYYGWGQAGPGQWVTLYTNDGHIYMIVAGLRFDTSGLSADGTRWHTSSRPTSGYVVRHPPGL
ncbi:MAG TPA: peptidoglycan-binding protein [Solirubrobacteraceae bacterium]|nr:peptidoglycan-binding protein [Solirubrobacteraceae bacterium]